MLEGIGNIDSLLGDFNSKIEKLKSSTGYCRIVTSNDNGERLLEVFEKKKLSIKNTAIFCRFRQKSTWSCMQSTERVKNQIDYILSKRNLKKHLLDSKSSLLEVETDHRLEVSRFDSKQLREEEEKSLKSK